MKINKILVPSDLQEVSIIALEHAVAIATKHDAEIVLLHVAKDSSSADQAQVVLNKWIDQVRPHFHGAIAMLIESGNFVDDIAPIAARENCQLVVMPTHGIQGMQHVTGSRALKVITEGQVPFIVVQKRGVREHGYKRMVIPITYRNQVLEEVNLFIDLAKFFESEVHLVAKREEDQYDESVLNSVVTKFEEAGLNFKLIHDEDGGNFAKHVVKYAASVDADLICAVNFAYENLYTLFPRTEEEDLIYNEAQIPVLLVTPEITNDSIYYIPIWH
jgi:nucleotide-binding universal stress UspA family protein